MRARSTVIAVLAALLAGGLSACSADPPEPGPVADALAAALASGDFAGVALAEGSPAPAELAGARTAAFEGLGEREPAVAVTSVTKAEDAEHATAMLHWSWDLGAASPWEYDVRAELDLVDGEGGPAWLARWRTGLLAPDLIDGETLALTRVRAERGDILGLDGQAIVEPRPVWRIGVDKTFVDEAGWDPAARALAAALAMDPEAYAQRVAAAGPKAFVEAIVVREGDPSYDVAALRAIPGVNAVSDTLPLAPTRQFARPILGQAGPATAEIIEASGGAIVAGDLTGLSGLQRQYDEQLRGAPGMRVEAKAGPVTRILFSVDPVAGVPLATTLDAGLQQAAEGVIAQAGGTAALVGLRPSTGEVLAAASAGGDGLSIATVGQYAPGSTFKVASALGLLRAGLSPDSTVTCPATATVDGREFRNFPGYPAGALGDIPLRTAFANSCNTAFIGQRDTLSQQALVEAASSLGLDPEPSLGFPAFLGQVPADSAGTEHAASLIGQGRVLASPLGMATVAASVAAGHTVTPVLVRPAEPADAAAASSPTPLTQEEADALQALMRGVVTDGGAGFLQDIPGVLAKTGTAQWVKDGETVNHAWMIAIHGDLAVAVFVELGDYGSTTAGPLMEAFLRAAG